MQIQNRAAVPSPATPPSKKQSRCPFSGGDRFGPSMPIVDGEAQVPSLATIARRLFFPAPKYQLPPLQRKDIGLSAQGPLGNLVVPGNQWPGEPVHPQFPEFKNLGGRAKAESVAHYARASRLQGKLDELGAFGLTASPQIIPDPVGMRWPFEPSAQVVAAYPREKNMHGRGAWGEIEVVPNPDPSRRMGYGILDKGGVGDFRMSLGADQSTNVVGAALGIPLGPNDQGVESANLLMLTGPGPQLDDLDYFAKPLSTVAIPNEETPTQFVLLDHLFKASAESGVRPGNHMFHYEQEGAYDPTVAIPAEVRLTPNPQLTLHKLAPLKTMAVDGVNGTAVREGFSNLKAEVAGRALSVRDLALSEALFDAAPELAKGQKLSLSVSAADGTEHGLEATVTGHGPDGTRVQFNEPSPQAQMALYQSIDLVWELSRRIEPGQELYRIDVKQEDGSWKEDVARVRAKSDFFPNRFADHERMYGHTERPNSTPVLRKVLTGIRFVTGSIGEWVASLAIASA